MSANELLGDSTLAGTDEWLALCDELLVGLVHAVNNRVAALSACSELAALGDSQMLNDGVLALEVERLRRASSLLELLPARDRPAEAVEVGPALQDAMQLHAHHPRIRAMEEGVTWQGTIHPVRTPRWALVRLLLLFVDAVKMTAHEARQERFELEISGEDDAVRLRGRARRSRMTYATGLAALCGGTLVGEGEWLVLTLPTLQALRRRERLARGGMV